MQTVLVTGASGMIGSKVVESLLLNGYEVYGVDSAPQKESRSHYTHLQVDIGNREVFYETVKGIDFTHIIHLAALAHTAGVNDLSWEHYYHVNVTCSENVFHLAAERNIPILFSSTADVYGITDGIVDDRSERHPIGNYGKSKCMAEDALKSICQNTPYTVMRFAPVYTNEIKRDIQKRYYLKYPKIAYRVGKGVAYEVLSMDNLVLAVVQWVACAEGQQVLNVKNEQLMQTADMIAAEKQAGRAKIVIWIPKWCVYIMFRLLRKISPKGWKTYMLNKVVNPLRTK